MRRLFPLVLVLLLCAATGVAFFSESLKRGEEATIQRQYAEAVEHFRAALDEETEGDRDRVLLLMGRAQFLSGDHAGAVATFQRFTEEHATSSLYAKARFSQADAHVASGEYREAAQIYRDEIEKLVGLERKEQIAGTYLGLAEKAMRIEPQEPARAVTFYDLALDLGLSEAKARSVRLAAADASLLVGNAGDAIQRFSPLAQELAIGEGKLHAMLGLGRAKLLAGDRVGARVVLRDLLRAAPRSEEAGDAAHEIARTFGVPTPQPAELDRAVTALLALASDYPEHPQAIVAKFTIAQCYRSAGRSEQSLVALREFLAESSERGVPEVALARAMVGDVLASQGQLDGAIGAWREYLAAHPAHQDWERVQRAIVDAEYQIAWLAYEEGEERFAEARELFDAFARSYPLDARNPDIAFALGEMHRIEEEFDAAREAFARCVSKYPGKEASSRAQFAIGEIFEKETFNYLEALRAYRAVTWGSWASVAQQRIAALERKHLLLRTPRAYRTGEKAGFELTSRNIPKARVRVFRLDLETYFRATHMAGGVEQLDIEVIEPDRVFETEVPGYQKYRETERKVDIGFDEPGAYVVVVDDQELEATTLVLVSDVALIAKSSRRELFVFSQNVKENRPEGGMKVVLSDGRKVVAEGVTGDDGVWRYKGEDLQNEGPPPGVRDQLGRIGAPATSTSPGWVTRRG